MTSDHDPIDVKEHNTEGDLWIIVNGGVYNLTKYAADHPGSKEVLLEVAGRDATVAFEDAGHSGDALSIMDDLLVGHIDDSIADVNSDEKSSVPSDRRPVKQYGIFALYGLIGMPLATGAQHVIRSEHWS